ncbi:carbohydrate ABC transporter permease [Desnuesiella massiliensis]|uniref:carbohydrate ABC transporter permease n=1 Tax=Desnuesiella massiliensis TaxID=1650662 RepID=UPI0006E3008C|nr:carbohydrate ABC transporter permease [Desnuesiella massiliensis]
MKYNLMWKNKIKSSTIYLMMIILGLLFLFPFIIMVLGSLQNKSYFSGSPSNWMPDKITLENFKVIMRDGYIGKWFLNSMIISIIPVLTSVILCTLLGYIFAKKNFWGKNVIFWMFLSMIMVPSQMLVMPNYILFDKLNWINTYKVFLIPNLWDITGFFLMRQFMLSVPDSLIEAAKLDGASEFQTFWRVIVPLSKQPMATISIFSFIGHYNNLFYPLIFTTDAKMYPMSVGIASLMTQNASFSLQMAGAVLNFLPTLIIFVSMQKYFTQGMATSGLKD